MQRTKFPKQPVLLNGVPLSDEEVAELESKYKPPLTVTERTDKETMAAAVPNNDHLTVWDPSKR